jgi:hypothetical protein
MEVDRMKACSGFTAKTVPAVLEVKRCWGARTAVNVNVWMKIWLCGLEFLEGVVEAGRPRPFSTV